MFYSENPNKKPSVNTHLESFFGSLSWLQLSGWDDKVSFKWTPSMGQGPNGRNQYNKDNAVSSALTHPKIEALLAKYETQLEAKIKANEDPGEDGICIGVPVISGRGENATTSGIFIEYKRNADGRPETFLTLIKNLTPNGGTAAASYKFETIPTLSGTDPMKGGFVNGHDEGEFEWFITILRQHCGIARFAEHSKKISDAFSANRAGNGNGQGGGDFMNPPAGDDPFSVFQ